MFHHWSAVIDILQAGQRVCEQLLCFFGTEKELSEQLLTSYEENLSSSSFSFPALFVDFIENHNKSHNEDRIDPRIHCDCKRIPPH